MIRFESLLRALALRNLPPDFGPDSTLDNAQPSPRFDGARRVSEHVPESVAERAERLAAEAAYWRRRHDRARQLPHLVVCGAGEAPEALLRMPGADWEPWAGLGWDASPETAIAAIVACAIDHNITVTRKPVDEAVLAADDFDTADIPDDAHIILLCPSARTGRGSGSPSPSSAARSRRSIRRRPAN